MQFGESGNPEHPLAMTFEGDEVEIVRAVFREYIYSLASHGNTNSISAFDANVAGWETGQDRVVHVQDHMEMTDRLDAFHDGTGEAIAEIAEVTGVPAHANEYLHERYLLGELAFKLAEDIREWAELGTSTSRIEAEFADILNRQNNP